MGAPMVRRLVEAGHDVRVARPHRREALGDRRTWAHTPVADLAAVADGADVVVVCVFTDDQVQQLCLRRRPASTAMAPGCRRWSCTPPAARAPPRRSPRRRRRRRDRRTGQRRPARYRRRPGHAVRRRRRRRRRSRRSRCSSAYGDPILHVGATGAGQLVKLVNNTLFAAQIGLVAEGGAARRPARHRRSRPARRADARQRGRAGRSAMIARGGFSDGLHRRRRRVHRQGRRGGPRDGRRTGRRPRRCSTTSSTPALDADETRSVESAHSLLSRPDGAY